jgi:hypothetical protein
MIGGAPMAGKSTVAKLLARRHARSVIATDDLGVAVHAALRGRELMIAENHREYFVTRSVDQLWQEALDRLRSLHEPVEAVARLHANPWATPAIVEGWAVLPRETEAPELDIGRVWLIAARDLLEARTRADSGFWSGASDEAAMIDKFVERSMRLNEYVVATGRDRPLNLLHVAASETAQALADRVEALFARK